MFLAGIGERTMNWDYRQLHRWVGLASVVFLTFIALTGIGLHYMAWMPSREWVTLIQQVHTGAIFGTWGPYLYDVISVGLVVLGVTGVVVWLRGRRLVEVPEVRESDLFGDDGLFTVVWEAGLRAEHQYGRLLAWCGQHRKRWLFERLLAHGDLEIKEGQVCLAESVKSVTLAHLRRHRLAERMLADWWHWHPDVLHGGVHDIEPVLDEEVGDGICRMLGHPKQCPHGSPIPSGACCQGAGADRVKTLGEAGTMGTAAFVFAKLERVYQEFVRVGALPGRQVSWRCGPDGVSVTCGTLTIQLAPDLVQSVLVAV